MQYTQKCINSFVSYRYVGEKAFELRKFFSNANIAVSLFGSSDKPFHFKFAVGQSNTQAFSNC